MTLVTWVLGVLGAGVLGWCALLLLTLANGYLAAALPLAAIGALALALAVVRGRREGRAPHLRHCLECGASVADDAGFCPRCQSVRLEAVAAGASASDARRSGREMPVTAYSPDASGTIGWVDSAPPGSWDEGGMGVRQLRRWGVALLGLAVVLAVAGVIQGV